MKTRDGKLSRNKSSKKNNILCNLNIKWIDFEIYTYKHTHTHAHAHTNTHTYARAGTHAHTHAYTHAHSHTHIHAHDINTPGRNTWYFTLFTLHLLNLNEVFC